MTINHRPPVLSTLVLLVISGFAVSSCSKSTDKAEPAPSTESSSGVGLNKPLTSFQQVLESSTKTLSLKANESFTVPVRVHNPGTERWMSVGKYPVNISYKWFAGQEMLPIEGERMALPIALAPNAAADAVLQVVAPPKAGSYSLHVTLVQEHVDWFFTRGGAILAIPATVR